MPLITLELSKKLAADWDPKAFDFAKFHTELSTILGAGPEHFKSRVYMMNDAFLGDADAEPCLIIITVKILAGRTQEVKDRARNHTLSYIRAAFARMYGGTPVECDCHIDEMVRDDYSKIVF